jgi:hypothetical protein
MSGQKIGWRAYVDSGLDASATSFFKVAGITDTTQKNSVNTLVKDLKRFGLWDKIKAFYPFVGGSATTHKWNLTNTQTYGLTFSGGWIHDSNGVKSNGSNTIADTQLNLRGAFGATSSEHNFGIYINDNPIQSSSVRGFRSDISASDSTNGSIDSFVSSPTLMFFRSIPSHDWFSFYVSATTVTGLNELKRYNSTYFCWFKDGLEVSGARQTVATTKINPDSTVKIGSSGSTNRYSTAYVTSALNTMESYLMYIAVQRFNSSLSRQSGTAIAPLTIKTITTTDVLVTNGLKINIDVQNQTQPNERSLTSDTPGLYYYPNDVLVDSSGNGNNGTILRLNQYDWQNRLIEYNKSDLGIPELRFRNSDNAGIAGVAGVKMYQSGTSPDYLQTLYKGSDTGTFTVGGWFKVSAIHNGFYAITRGHDAYSGGWSFILSMSIGSKFSINLVPTSGSISGAFQSTTIVQSDVWYNVYVVWKPNSYVKMYVNGVLQATNTMTCPGFRSSNAGWSVNSIGSGSSSRGILGAMHVYDRELTAAEVLQNFNSGRGRYNISSSSDADAQAFISAANITNDTQINAVSTLVTALKTAGIWTKMKAIYPFVGGTADSHKFNLKDPRDDNAAFRLTFSGGWTHSSTGALPNGTNGYANTYFIDYYNITNNDTQPSNFAHASIYSRTNSPSITQYGGIGVNNSHDGYGYFMINTKRADGLSYGAARGTLFTTPTTMTDSRGLFLINRQSISLLKYSRNNSLISQNTNNLQQGASRIAFYLGAANNWGSADYFDNKEHSLVTLGYSLTDEESTSLYTAVQAFQTALGRQV